MTDSLLDDVTAFLARLVAPGRTVTAFSDALQEVGETFPHAVPALEAIRAALGPRIAALPAVVQHGDLVLGNVLAENDRLVGIVDWETWHPAGVPGVDLLQLVVEDEGSRRDDERSWGERVWRSSRFGRAAGPYFAALDVKPSDRVLDAIAVAWWANRICILMRRPERRHLAHDPGWVDREVTGVLATLVAELKETDAVVQPDRARRAAPEREHGTHD